ncbi:MAG TPA: LPS export ABC transporter permease LptG [Terracidiphilus sp.]|nr:LPS export ABC transporter permease LptG [Terracidiphilus sp.]
MRILTRYISGEILSHAVIGGVIFTFILFMKELPHILEMVVRNSSTFSSVVEIVLFMLPNFFMITIPMAVLVGVLLGLSRLAADSEIIAMRASGLGIGYFVRVASIVAVFGTLLCLFNSLYVAPRANRAILAMDKELAAQASYEIQPRVFDEDFHNYVLYVQDVRSGTGAANWRQVFMADTTDPTTPLITTAASATVANDSNSELLMRLRDGAHHETVVGQPQQYNISTFDISDMPLAASQQNEGHLGRMDTAIYALSMSELRAHSYGPDSKKYLLEMHKRFAYPAACLVLMLVAVPLGVTSRRGGKSSAWVATLVLVVIYYSLSLIGVALGKQNWISAFLAVWMANFLFAAGGLFLLWQMVSGGRVLNAIVSWTLRFQLYRAIPIAAIPAILSSGLLSRFQPRSKRTAARSALPRILDKYVVSEFLNIFFLVLAGFVVLILVFTVFDLLKDILSHDIGWLIVGQYLINLTPSMIYQITPLAVLIAVLVTFGVLNRNSEIIAMKASGISLYRLMVPIIAIAILMSAGLFVFDQYYLPQANQRQEALRNTIKGKPPQTVLHPEQNWIYGQPNPGEPDRIFYYQFFDSGRNEFANLSIFEFNPTTFALSRRIFAARAVWDSETDSWRFLNGWQRDIDGANVSDYREFLKTSFAEIHESPGYFQKESKKAQEMNFGQLESYIGDLSQSGFDTMRLRVELWHKLAYPLMAVVMAALAIPFALSMGRRGSLTGIAVAIAVTLAYFVVDGLFGALGDVNYLPAALAAWSSDLLFGLVGGYLLLRTPT